jgi:uncharacterized protein
MLYVDTSVLVALFTNEATAERITTWFAGESRPLVSGDWCVTEFASALALKQRTQQISAKQSNAAWKVFNQFCDQSLRLLPLDRDIFNQAANLIRNSKNSLRAGDALHLALALRIGAVAFFTLDLRLAESAKHSKLLPVDF